MGLVAVMLLTAAGGAAGAMVGFILRARHPNRPRRSTDRHGHSSPVTQRIPEIEVVEGGSHLDVVLRLADISAEQSDALRRTSCRGSNGLRPTWRVGVRWSNAIALNQMSSAVGHRVIARSMSVTIAASEWGG